MFRNTDIQLRNTSEISIEELEHLHEEGIREVIIYDPRGTKDKEIYRIETFVEIKKEILQYVSDIPDISVDDPDREKKIFSYIYAKIAKNIIYDEKVAGWSGLVGYERDAAEASINRASNLEGILCGAVLCSGYAEILRNILAEAGIESLYIGSGKRTRAETKENSLGSHAWNQVRLDGKWYNCDITNDADFILAGLKLPFFLKSNEEFDRYKKYPCKEVSKVQEATESVSDERQEELIEEARQILSMQEFLKENAQKENVPIEEETEKGFIAKLNRFFKLKKVSLKKLKNLSEKHKEEKGID